jgi:hypothetical protein
MPIDPSIMGLRLSPLTGVPDPNGDTLGATSLFLVPYVSGAIALFDGTAWQMRTTNTSISLALGTLTFPAVYDVYAYWTGSAIALELLVWSGLSTPPSRDRQDGVLVKHIAPTRRYVGSIRPSSATTIDDSVLLRGVWNFNNRVPKNLYVAEATGTWTYNSAVWRQVLNPGASPNGVNQFGLVIGVSEWFEAVATMTFQNTLAGAIAQPGILDDTQFISGGNFNPDLTVVTQNAQQNSASGRVSNQYFYARYLDAGARDVYWVESGSASGTTTMYSSDESGMAGRLLM